MQGKDYWNIIANNAKCVTSLSEFCRCCAVLMIYCRISVTYSFSFTMSHEVQKVQAIFMCTVLSSCHCKNTTILFQRVWYLEALPYVVQKPDNNSNNSTLIRYLEVSRNRLPFRLTQFLRICWKSWDNHFGSDSLLSGSDDKKKII